MSRQRYYSEIDYERELQIATGYTPECDAAHFPNDWIAILTRHLGLAVNDGASESDRFRKQLVRVAATAVAALEDYDLKHPKHLEVKGDSVPNLGDKS